MTNVKSLPGHGKLPSLQRGKFANKDSITAKLAALQSVSELLNDLSPQQIEKFNKAVKRSPLFNQ